MKKEIIALCFLTFMGLTVHADELLNKIDARKQELQMNIELQNKKIVEKFFELFSAGNAKQAFALVAPDVKWWVPESLSFGGTYDRTGYLTQVLSQFFGFQGPLKLTIKSMISDGDSMAVEVESYAVHTCGDPEPFVYNNNYHFKIILKDGLFVDVKEYMDTYHLSKLYDVIQSATCRSNF